MQVPHSLGDTRPIGLFDSGFGGLTVARAVIDLLPCEDVVYVGDTARYPYGDKPIDDVRRYSIEVAEYLVAAHDVKFVVVACNTATAAALDDVARAVGRPVIGVIQPGLAALAATTLHRVGVIGTVGTVNSGAYPAAVERLGLDLQLQMCACPGFVEFVERGQFNSPSVRRLASETLRPLIGNVDALLLGCTHYPFLARAIRMAIGPEVVLVSSADETAFALAERLAAQGLTHPDQERCGEHRFVSSGDVSTFVRLGRRLLGPELESAVAWSPPALAIG